MRGIFVFSLMGLSAAAPSVTFDYNCTPNVVCTLMVASIARGGIGLAGVNEISIKSTSPLHRSTSFNFTCPRGYCKDVGMACLEYPPSSTKEDKRKHRCVPSDELKMMNYQLESMYTTNSVVDGDEFYFRLENIPSTGCV